MARRKKEFDTESRTFISPRNIEQKCLVDSIINNSITVVSGIAGTGKTLVSIQTLYKMYKARQIDQIVVVRLIADTFGEHLGSLPGEMGAKLEHFLGPIKDNLAQFLPPGEIQALIDQKVIEAIPVSHCRGRSFFRKGVLVEEAQNMTNEMILCILTRIANESRLVFNGDPLQVDFYGRNGILYLQKILHDLPDVGVIELPSSKSIRHPLIARIVSRSANLKLEESPTVPSSNGHAKTPLLHAINIYPYSTPETI
jgi:phosphate starvation-inducible PhoH-like protein